MTLSTQPVREHLTSNGANSYPKALLQGEILVKAKPYSNWGGAAAAQMYLPLERRSCWQQLTNYSRWVEYFPDLTRSELLRQPNSSGRERRIYQVGSKNFIIFSTRVEIYLKVMETAPDRIHFQLEKGTFTDFSASLQLQDYNNGIVLTYSVRATPNFPIPTIFIQQALQLELPANMRQMRSVLCR